MSVQQLDFAEPFFSIDYIENEQDYFVEKKSIVINLAERTGRPLKVRTISVIPLKGTVAENVWIKNVDRAMVVKDYLRCDLNDIPTIQAIKKTWKSLYEMSGLERHKGLPYYKSPKFKTGEGSNHLELNFCFVSEPMAPSGPHLNHDRNFDEVHAQIRGYGKMRIFAENDVATFYEELNLAPGTVHDKMYDESGIYPWHDYQSVTPCVYCPIELDR